MSSKEKKQIVHICKLQLKAGSATPAPPVGTILGPKGINMMEFCRTFNDQTASKGDAIIPVIITIYKDKTFTLAFKEPPVPFLIKKEIKLAKGSNEPGKKIVSNITMSQIRKIAEMKMSDLNAYNIEAAVLMVVGTARSMGVDVLQDN
jgi:large subunit ribosomal protein L11